MLEGKFNLVGENNRKKIIKVFIFHEITTSSSRQKARAR